VTATRFGRPGRRSPALLAGWLFADLLLMLFLISLATQASGSSAHPHPSPTTSRSPSPSPSPSPTQGFISKKFCEMLLPLSTEGIENNNQGAESQLISALNTALAGQDPGEILDDPVNADGDQASCLSQLPRHLRVGVVIAYGASPDIGTGVTLGQNAVADIIRRSPRFSGASSFSGWTGEHGSNAVELIIFFVGV
jgi:hypothetical protein